MLNQAKEDLNKLIQRLEMIFQVQTHEVVPELKKIRELLETSEIVEVEPTEEIVEEPKQEVIKETIEQKTYLDPIKDGVSLMKNNHTYKIKESKEDVVKRYIEKFQKKPFAGRSVEVLKEKMGE